MLVVTERIDTWVQEGIRTGERLLAEHDIDAVWTTSGPMRSISIGRHLAQRHKLPWIADLRDSISHLSGSKSESMTQYIKRRGFALRLRGAARIVEVTPQERERDLAWLSTQVEVIPSGFDPDEWTRIHRRVTEIGSRSKRDLAIVFTGRVYGFFDLNLFFRGFQQLVHSATGYSDARIEYYGPSGDGFIAAAEACGVEAHVHDHGMVNAETARTAMAQADILLIFSRPGVSGIPGGKLYDYLASATPILVVPAGDEYIEGVLSSSSAGLVASTPEDIGRALDTLASQPPDVQPPDFQSRVELFGWPGRAKKLAGLLDEAVQDPSVR